MTQVRTHRPISAPRPRATPPLQQGDRLSRAEFERRYQGMPDVKKAELIEGVVYMPSPVSEGHSHSQVHIITWLGVYEAATPGVVAGDNGTILLDLDNVPQPDAHLRIEERCGGQSKLSPNRYVEGAPEVITEVAVSSASYDLHDKLNVYRRSGVREYLVWRVDDEAFDWFILREGRYEPLEPVDGLHRSEMFPGLWLDTAALLKGDLATVLAALQTGIADASHAAFVEKLQAAQKA